MLEEELLRRRPLQRTRIGRPGARKGPRGVPEKEEAGALSSFFGKLGIFVSHSSKDAPPLLLKLIESTMKAVKVEIVRLAKEKVRDEATRRAAEKAEEEEAAKSDPPGL